ncbi:MAG: hypothetical protein K2J29_04615, partial [Muribaculaceae bacterium]|nr:hypothetical protein [Muribaculaceae bacterium]
AYNNKTIVEELESLLSVVSGIEAEISKLVVDALDAQAALDADKAAQEASDRALADGNAQVERLRDSLAEALNTIAEMAADVKDEFTGDAITEAIDRLQESLNEAYNNKTIVEELESLLSVVSGIEAEISKLIVDALDAQKIYDDEWATEQIRQKNNLEAYNTAMADVKTLQQKLDNTIAEISEKYPDFEVIEASVPIQEMIDTLRQVIEIAYEAVAYEGIFDYTVDGSEVEHAIEMMMEAAGINIVMGEMLDSRVRIYIMEGVQVERLVQGQINLIVYPDGRRMKVYVK